MGNETDEQVGRNLAAMRGKMSQATLASAMRDLGWKWSQPTVAAIEKGERPLKVAEADDLLEILRIDSIDELVTRPLESIWWATYEGLWEAKQELQAATHAYLEARWELAEIADRMLAAGEKSDQLDVFAETMAWVTVDVHSVGLDISATRLPDIKDDAGPHLRALAMMGDYQEFYHLLATPTSASTARRLRNAAEGDGQATNPAE